MSISVLGIETAQDWEDILILERVIIEHNIDLIIELGVWKGGLSLYLKCLSINIGARYYGYDTTGFTLPPLGSIVSLDSSITLADIFEPSTMRSIQEHINSSKRALIICDDGNKVREFNTFSYMLRTNDLITAHDWDREICDKDVENTVTECGLDKLNYEFRSYSLYKKR